MTELRECPFCGGEAEFIRPPGGLNDTYSVVCKSRDCGANKGQYRSRAQAITAWNTRAEPQPRALSLEELRELVGKPVWVETMNEWRIVIMSHDKENVNLYNVYNTISAKHVLNNDGRIYDREPKGE